MHNILIISDNAKLTRHLQREYLRQGLVTIANLTFCYSYINKNPSQMIELGATSINIKDNDVINIMKRNYSLIISLHCKQIFPAELVNSVVCINIHPGFNPYNRGWYPQVFSIINKMPVGATIHVMDDQVDHGDIIDQIEVESKVFDTSLELYERILDAEMLLITQNLSNLLHLKYDSTPVKADGNYNSIKDFKSLCKLNLDAVGTLREHIDLLRALSHGDFKNAYFTDDNGKKIYLRIDLVPAS